MAGKAILTCRPTSHPFQDRTLLLDHPVKIGRSVARARANSINAIFDCKVLSRNHAVIWYADGKFYLQDTRSSNGTFVNNQRLSKSGEESAPREVSSGDIVQFGVDVLESTRKVTHGCIIANLKLYLPDGKEAKSSNSTAVISSNTVHVEDLYELHQYIQEAVQRENLLETKLLALQEMFSTIKEAANQGWKALICEDRLLTRVEALENQLIMYSKNHGEEKLKEELKKLQEDKNQYQCTAKGFFKKVLEEKLEAVQNCQEVKRSLINVEAQYNNLNEELVKSREHVQDLAQRLSAQIARNEDFELKIQEIEEHHKDALSRLESRNRELEEMLSRQHVTEACLEKQLEVLREAENRTTAKPISFELELKPSIGTEIQVDGNELICKDLNNDEHTFPLDRYNDDHRKNKEVVDLLKAQLELLDAEKLARLKQINSIQDNYELYDLKQLEYEKECQEVEVRIENLESQIRQKTIQQLSSDDSPFDGRESNGRIVNGLNDPSLEPIIECQISKEDLKGMLILQSEIKNKSNACELSKNCLREELDLAKKNLSQLTESYIVTQENLSKAQKELEDTIVITDSHTSNGKMLDEYSNDEKYPFHDNDLHNQNNINNKSSEKEDVMTLKKSVIEAQQREKQNKSEAELKDKIVALTSKLESRGSASEDNKVREELEEAKQECVKSKGLINILESELKDLREECLQLRFADSSFTKAELSNQDAKVAALEEKLITLGTKYMECNEEKAKLARRLESLKLDYQAISHQKYFNLFFALPCILLLLALTIAFYPTLSFFMGTADQPDEQDT
uniref:Sarcolemmal membrane-associated protein n=1 Tax=Lygus hesperus TaxID=30085 RepID=A0A146LTZ3_LYGHE